MYSQESFYIKPLIYKNLFFWTDIASCPQSPPNRWKQHVISKLINESWLCNYGYNCWIEVLNYFASLLFM